MVISQPFSVSTPRGRGFTLAVALSVGVHIAILAWLLGQTWRGPDIAAPIPTPTIDAQTVTLTRLQPSSAPPDRSRRASAPTRRQVMVKLATVTPRTATTAADAPTSPFIQAPGIGKLELGGPPPLPPSVITDPDWIARPGADEITRAYPERALREGIGGAVSLTCEVTASGGVSGCVVAGETPQGYGFGRAALGLTSRFRMRPRTIDGQPVGGASVRIPLRFAIAE